MDIFRTIVPVKSSEKKINYSTSVVFIGSCFSEYIGNKLTDSKFSIDNNPFGIVYNPLSVRLVLDRLIENKLYSKDELFNFEGIWSSFDHHSRFSDIDASKCLNKINERLVYSSQFLAESDFLFLTFGTAYVYSRKSDNKIVSNCHKIPTNEFNRYRLSIDEIIAAYTDILNKLFQYNPKIKIVFTVSPVRHWKDGAHENQLSKSTLLLAVEQISKLFEKVTYFPSYELMMDDLRDYRFYEEDMVHPNKVAVNYIWGKFKDSFMDLDTQTIMKEVEKIISARNHRPFNPKSEPYQDFIRQNLDKIKHLKNQFDISFVEEEGYFNQLLK